MGFAGHFMTTRQPLGVLKTRTGEMRLVANPRTVNTAGEAVEPYGGPLALLVDPLTVSTSEIFAAGMQAADRARVFGETTAGQALPAMAVKLPNEDVLMHVVADLTVPGGERVEGAGVVPDERVPLTRAALLAGRDAVLERAIAWILGPRTD
jgi:carboxyl-terminal processing protease